MPNPREPHHPLDGLTTQEYWTVHDVLQTSGHLNDATLFSSVLLHEPAEDKILAWKDGDSLQREADVILEANGKTIESRVDISHRLVESWQEITGVQAPITATELDNLSDAVKRDTRVIAALKHHRITDLGSLRCEPIPLTFNVFPEQAGHRIGYGDCTDSQGVYHAWDRTIEGVYFVADITE